LFLLVNFKVVVVNNRISAHRLPTVNTCFQVSTLAGIGLHICFFVYQFAVNKQANIARSVCGKPVLPPEMIPPVCLYWLQCFTINVLILLYATDYLETSAVVPQGYRRAHAAVVGV